MIFLKYSVRKTLEFTGIHNHEYSRFCVYTFEGILKKYREYSRILQYSHESTGKP